MVIKYEKYPNYLKDEPIIVRQFNGGINTDPSDGNLLENELKDAVNFTYNNNVLEKRLGAQVVHQLGVNLNPALHQGLFTFATKSKQWMVIANDGKLLYAPINGTNLQFSELAIRVDDFMLLNETDASPYNVITGLPKSTSYLAGIHTGYVFSESSSKGKLVFQNARRIEAAALDYKLYMATGTRFILIEEATPTTLKASIVKPKVTYGQEQKMIGFNYLSPFPEYLVEDLKDAALTSISNIYNTKIQTIPGTNVFKAVMTYGQGKSAGDYRFKWELSSDDGRTWKTLTQYRDQKAGVTPQPPTGKGVDSIAITGMANGLTYRIRCSFAAAFKQTLNQDDKKFYYVEEANGIDWVVDNVDGEWFGQAVTQVVCRPAEKLPPNQTFLNIHSCAKILADGNKLILYDDINETGNWYKTVIGKYDYITDRGSLNFQTNKNEKIIKVVNFQGVMVVFSNNRSLGGNIAVVSGNGDDIASDNSYSPYQRKVVNTSITADNPNSVQMSGNYLLFKHKDTVYLMDNSSLNAEILEVISVNDRIQIKNTSVSVPWQDENYYTEVTPDYYAIVWPNAQQRWKMYHRYPTRIGDDQKVFFPWLRDESPSFDILDTLIYQGVATHVGEDYKLLQYSAEDYKDEGTHIYEVALRLKSNELRLPGFLKFVQSLDVSYYRGQNQPCNVEFDLRNEAGHAMCLRDEQAFIQGDSVQYENLYTHGSPMDYESLHSDSTLLSDTVRLGHAQIETKTLIPHHHFPCVAAELSLRMASPQRFSFVGVIFHYHSTGVADSTVYDLYSKIILPKELKGGNLW